MPASAAYARIKADVYRIAASIPSGRLTTYAAIGAFLEVVPRQVAYLLALQNDDGRNAVPWHRVVGDDGALGRPKRDPFGRTQAELLIDEGVQVERGHLAGEWRTRLVRLTPRGTGVKPTPRMP